MKNVGIYEAKTKLPSLINAVERGETITITRHGKPVAKLVPVQVKAGDMKAMLREMKAFRDKHPFDGVSTKELINEGRKY
jgi:prevent-host-death family protein